MKKVCSRVHSRVCFRVCSRIWPELWLILWNELWNKHWTELWNILFSCRLNGPFTIVKFAPISSAEFNQQVSSIQETSKHNPSTNPSNVFLWPRTASIRGHLDDMKKISSRVHSRVCSRIWPELCELYHGTNSGTNSGTYFFHVV